jgi:CubicO group peptidase (beta-lactamase class C family)
MAEIQQEDTHMIRWLRAAGAAFLLAMGGSAAAPDDSAIGLWSYQTRYFVGLKGDLLLSRAGRRWLGTIAGTTAEGTQSGDEVRIAFPHEGGTFRGTFINGELHGFWARRAVTEDPNFPFGEAMQYAGVLALQKKGRGRWRATVVPLEDTFTLYLNIFRDSDGALKAAFRNPELNSHGPAMQLSVTHAGDHLQFSAQPDPTKAPVTIGATLLHNPNRISLFWDDLKKTIVLDGIAPAQGARFFPRPPGSKPYFYRTPAENGDGWVVARAREVGMDETVLARAVQRIIEIDPAAERAWLIHSMTVARHGKLVLDEYFYGFGRDQPHDTRSASKTFSAVLLGAVMLDGTKISTASRMSDVMTPLKPFANPDPRKDRITLGHLLTHSAGLACDDNAAHSPGNEDAMEADLAHPDWTRLTIDLPMEYEPGTHYAYCSMNINMAGAMLSRATGEWLPELFDRTVARPLRFGPYYWNLQGTGDGYLGGGVFLRNRDFLKVGQAYLDWGVWKGHRIATRQWVKTATAEQIHVSPATTGRSGSAFTSNYYDTGDGFAWHLYKVKSGDREYPCWFANGNGGQLLIVLPQFDLVAVFTAGNYGQGVWNRERDDVLGGMILPAILD